MWAKLVHPMLHEDAGKRVSYLFENGFFLEVSKLNIKGGFQPSAIVVVVYIIPTPTDLVYLYCTILCVGCFSIIQMNSISLCILGQEP